MCSVTGVLIWANLRRGCIMGMDLLCSKMGTHMTASGETVRFMAKENCGAAMRMRCQKVRNAKGMLCRLVQRRVCCVD